MTFSESREETGKVREGYSEDKVSFSGSGAYGLRRMSPGKSKHSKHRMEMELQADNITSPGKVLPTFGA